MSTSNMRIIYDLQGHIFWIVARLHRKSRANLNGESAVSTRFSTGSEIRALPKKRSPQGPQMSQNRGFPVLPQGSRLKTASCVLDCPRTAKEPYGQQKERADKPKNPVNGNTQDPQRQPEQPHHALEHDTTHPYRPAHTKQAKP